MKITKEGQKLINAFAVAFLLLPLLGAGNLKGATQKKTLSPKRARWLISHAETPVQHAQLAVYYHQQANRFQKEAKEHNEMTWPEVNAAKHGWLG